MKKPVAEILSAMCSRWMQRQQGPYNFPYKFPLTREELGAVKFSFSECGEDLSIIRVVKELGLGPGIYVDAGAFQPIRGSHTLLLYKSGWRGINIDLEEAKIAEFRESRPGDYNVLACLSDSVQELQVAHYNDSRLDRVVSGNGQSQLHLWNRVQEPHQLAYYNIDQGDRKVTVQM